MGSTLKQKIDQLPPPQRLEIDARANELILEELSLRTLRKELNWTQEEIAQAIGVGQDSVSRMENRYNIMVATLERYVRAMGGHLSIIAEFPDRPPVKLSFEQLSEDVEGDDRAHERA